MDLLILAAIAVFIGIILVSMGLSFLSQSLNSLEYNSEHYQWGSLHTSDYYKNPLCKINSKWFYYRPKGWVIVSKNQWKDIEKNIGVKITEAKETGKALGYKSAVSEIQYKVREEEAKITPTSPYQLLGVKATTSLRAIKERYEYLMQIYSPGNFTVLDDAFTELAEIRTAQFTRAWKHINLPAGASHGDI